jgi:hypothetical protein
MLHAVKGSISNDSLTEINLFGSVNKNSLINNYFTKTKQQARCKLDQRPQSTKRIEKSKPVAFFKRPCNFKFRKSSNQDSASFLIDSSMTNTNERPLSAKEF